MGRGCSTPVSTTHNGHLTAESSTLVFGVDGVERQEKASLAPLFIWAGALFESQQHAMHWPEKHPSLYNMQVFVHKEDGCQVCGIEGFRQGKSLSHYQYLKPQCKDTSITTTLHFLNSRFSLLRLGIIENFSISMLLQPKFSISKCYSFWYLCLGCINIFKSFFFI